MAAQVGSVFGRLTVIAGAADKAGHWVCTCTCGATATYPSKVFVGSRPRRSCGCLQRELASSCATALSTRHGNSKSPTYKSWVEMRRRCRVTTKGRKTFTHYAGRGISVCERWSSFETFLADMGERPPGKTLDRFPNRDGDYEPSNCRWATPTEQCRNRSTNRVIAGPDGSARSVAEWAEVTGIKATTISWRIRHGETDERALMPVTQRS